MTGCAFVDSSVKFHSGVRKHQYQHRSTRISTHACLSHAPDEKEKVKDKEKSLLHEKIIMQLFCASKISVTTKRAKMYKSLRLKCTHCLANMVHWCESIAGRYPNKYNQSEEYLGHGRINTEKNVHRTTLKITKKCRYSIKLVTKGTQ